MYAHIAALYVRAHCKQTFNNSDGMESTVVTGGFLDVFDFKSFGSHKYIPTEKLNEDLGLPQGGGVFGYIIMADGSYLLRTCGGRLAYWSGKKEDAAQFPNDRKEKI